MRKITADYIYPVNVVPIENGVVHISDSGEILFVGNQRNGDEHYFLFLARFICFTQGIYLCYYFFFNWSNNNKI